MDPIIVLTVSKLNPQETFDETDKLARGFAAHVADFAAPSPDVATVEADKDALKALLAARVRKADELQGLDDQIRAATEKLKGHLRDWIKYAPLAAKEPQKLHNVGFELKGDKQTVVAAVPEKLEARMGAHSGEIALRWRLQKGVLFLIQSCPDVTPRVWKDEPPEKKSRTTLDGFTSGQKYIFRVCAKAAKNTSGWSDLAQCMAP